MYACRKSELDDTVQLGTILVYLSPTLYHIHAVSLRATAQHLRIFVRQPTINHKMAEGMSVAILVVSWLETCIGLVFLALRFLSTWKFQGRFRWDFAAATLTVVGFLRIVLSEIHPLSHRLMVITYNVPRIGYTDHRPAIPATLR
jgi:hypothetical protein